MQENTRQFDTGRIKFTFTDVDGRVFASFYMNPTDVGVLERAEEISEFFNELKKTAPDVTSGATLSAYNKMIEEKINYLLGYDASSEIFGEVTATTISPDGEIFAHVVLDTISESLGPEIKRRREKMVKRVAEYTAKYRDQI